MRSRRTARALALGAAASLALAVPPVAAQDLGDPLGFLRRLQDIPLAKPRLPDSQAPAEADRQAGEAGSSELLNQPPHEAAATGAAGLPEGGAPAGNGTEDAPAAAAPEQARGGAETPAPAELSQGRAGPSETISSYALRPFRLGVLAGRDVSATMAALEPVSEGLAGALGRSVDILPMSSYRTMIDAQQSQRIDGGFYSAEAFAAAEAECRCLEPLVAPQAGDGTSSYYAIIVAGPEAGIASVADLGGKVVATGAADSVAGRRMQIAALANEGFDLPAAAAELIETASADEAVRLVVEGEADAALAWSSLEGDLATGYSRGTLADLVASGDIGIEEVAVVWRSPAIPHGPVAVAKALPDQDKSRIETYFLGLNDLAPAAYDILNPFYSGGYVAVEPDDYRGLDALAARDIQPLRPAADPADADRTGAAPQ